MQDQVIAANLVRLRKDRNVTQERLAEAAGLSRSAYRAVEKGRSLPRMDTLRSLAAALNVPVRELVSPVPELRQVRFRSLKRLKSRDQVLAEVGRWLQDFNQLEAMLGQQMADGLEPQRRLVPEVRGQGVEAVAQLARAQFGLNEREPVHDICGLLESRGVKVFQVEVANDAFLGLSVGADDGGPAVVVNTWTRLAVEHWIYSAAHELGHLLLHLDAYDVTREDEVEDEEKEAEVFASHFLMPRAAFEREWRDASGFSLLDRVLKVKRVFRVSWRAVMYRATESVPDGEKPRWWQRIQLEYKRRYGRPLLKLTEPNGVLESVFRQPEIASRGTEPAQLDAHDFQGDRLARLIRQAVEEERISLGRAAEILGLSLADMRDRAASWLG